MWPTTHVADLWGWSYLEKGFVGAEGWLMVGSGVLHQSPVWWTSTVASTNCSRRAWAGMGTILCFLLLPVPVHLQSSGGSSCWQTQDAYVGNWHHAYHKASTGTFFLSDSLSCEIGASLQYRYNYLCQIPKLQIPCWVYQVCGWKAEWTHPKDLVALNHFQIRPNSQPHSKEMNFFAS